MPNTSIVHLCGRFGSHARKAKKGNVRHADNPKYKSKTRQGGKLSEIAAHEKVSVPTVRKYLAVKDFSPTLPVRKERPSILDPYKGVIEGYLDEDEHSWHK